MVTKAPEKAVRELMNDALDAAEATSPLVEGFRAEGIEGALEVASAGERFIWNILTGDRSKCNLNMLEANLNKRNTDGSRVYTTDFLKVKGKPVIGTLKCPLNAGHPEREKYASWGFPECKKANLKTMMDVRTHTRAAHQREFDAIEEDKKAAIEAENRRFQQSIMARSARE